MSDASSHKMISRRSTRVFAQDLESCDFGKGGGSRPGSYCEDKEIEKDRLDRASRSSSVDQADMVEATIIRTVDLGRDMHDMFPANYEDMDKQVARILQTSRAAGKKNQGRPINFGDVIPGVYRSSFPQTEDYEFLKSLKLKTIVTLVKKEYPDGFCAFIKANGIRHVIIDMQGTKKVAIPHEMMQSIMKVVLDKSNHPLLMHCNHGKHRTGCATAVIRHLSGWHVDSVVAEYTNYAQPKVRDCDIEYIQNYQSSNLEGLFLLKKKQPRPLLPSKMLRMLFLAATAIVLFCTGFPVSTVHF
ncbi:hypothetical protein BP5796_02677 [Coleophoma crateriformis]|uniref:Uncharacterized protein n=1 Tax=Coleophoma crateriformis TaxID=565419 RepID=A0A3D8SYX7_9HELO|nr:hypothetical protein BP5796_02677 [Coleophoma crateriformis]